MERLEKERSTEITNRHRKRAKIREADDERENKWVGGRLERNHNRKHTARAAKEEVQSKDNVNNRVVSYSMAGDCWVHWNWGLQRKSNQSLCGDSDAYIIDDPRKTFWNRNNSENTHRQYICLCTISTWLSKSFIWNVCWIKQNWSCLGIFMLLHEYTADSMAKNVQLTLGGKLWLTASVPLRPQGAGQGWGHVLHRSVKLFYTKQEIHFFMDVALCTGTLSKPLTQKWKQAVV